MQVFTIDCYYNLVEAKDVIHRWLMTTKRILRRLAHGQRGGLLLETVVAVAILGVVGSAVLAGVQTSSISKGQFDAQSTAENILRNQMEYLYEQAYEPPSGTYLTVASPPGYSVTTEALVYEETSTDIETVRVTVYKDGQPLKTMETLRANR